MERPAHTLGPWGGLEETACVPLTSFNTERGGRCEAIVEGARLPRRHFFGGFRLTDEVPDPVAVLPDDWFQRAQRTFADLQFRAERRGRELSIREQELEVRSRDLAERAEQLREAFRKAEEASQDLMARTSALREEERAVAEGRGALARDRQEVERARGELDAQRAELARREAVLADLDGQIRSREGAVRAFESEIRALRAEQGQAPSAAEPPPDSPQVSSPPPAGDRDPVRHLVELEEALEAATKAVHTRQGEADRLLTDATTRAAEVQSLEERIREHEARLDAVRSEIVDAKQALLAVDDALARMPYEVVDDFTKSEEFDRYERAVRTLRRFEGRPTAAGPPARAPPP